MLFLLQLQAQQTAHSWKLKLEIHVKKLMSSLDQQKLADWSGGSPQK